MGQLFHYYPPKRHKGLIWNHVTGSKKYEFLCPTGCDRKHTVRTLLFEVWFPDQQHCITRELVGTEAAASLGTCWKCRILTQTYWTRATFYKTAEWSDTPAYRTTPPCFHGVYRLVKTIHGIIQTGHRATRVWERPALVINGSSLPRIKWQLL